MSTTAHLAETSAGSVLWYVHDQGRGHLERCRAVVEHTTVPVVVASSHPDLKAIDFRRAVAVRRLRTDRVPHRRLGHGPWHYAPVAAGARRRWIDLMDTIDEHGCTTAVIDVSAETAVLCRLAGLKVIALRQTGHRSDPAHQLAHDSADVVWVPQLATLDPEATELARVCFTGGFSRFDRRPVHRCASRQAVGTAPDRRLVVVAVGQGGSSFPEAAWRTEEPPSGVDVVLIGLRDRWHRSAVRSVGFVDDPFHLLCAADAVVAASGWGTVHDVASTDARAALVAETRPFDEQVLRARHLGRAGAVHVLETWPVPADLTAVLAATDALRADRWSGLYDHRGAERAAQMIESVHRGD